MAGGTAIQVDVGYCDSAGIVRPHGACTLLTSVPILRWIETLPPHADVVFDLSLATGLDSTFAGMLVSLARPRSHAVTHKIHLASPSATARDALQRMHVLPIFDVMNDWPETPRKWEPLPAVPTDADRTARCMLDAHEQLIDADARNKPVFSNVVEGLRRAQKTGG